MYSKDKVTLIDRRELLRIKVKSLAVEARIIRQPELKTHGTLRTEMYLHRVGSLRKEGRAAGLALGFIKGRCLEEMEPGRTQPKTAWEEATLKATMIRVNTLITKYGPKNFVMATEPTEVRKAKQERGMKNHLSRQTAKTEYRVPVKLKIEECGVRP